MLNKKEMHIVQLTPFFSPNVGGVETHLDDLVSELSKRKIETTVLTYSPLTSSIKSLSYEKLNKFTTIHRFKWPGFGVFNFLEKYPFLDFLYLTPYLLIRSYKYILKLKNSNKKYLIHAHGLNAALIGVFYRVFFGSKLVVSTHAVYELTSKSKYVGFFIRKILNRSSSILCLSQASINEICRLGVEKELISRFKYWVNTDYFRPLSSDNERSDDESFTILFVGRLIEKKGINLFINAAKLLPRFNFRIVGGGPLANAVLRESENIQNLVYYGEKNNNELRAFYNEADIFCIPSLYEEGFGRVIMEALSCGLPVLGSNKGGIPEALSKEVGVLFEPTTNNLIEELKKIESDRLRLKSMKRKCRKFALENYSSKNIEIILDKYKQHENF